jgi:hypothetical protein
VQATRPCRGKGVTAVEIAAQAAAVMAAAIMAMAMAMRAVQGGETPGQQGIGGGGKEGVLTGGNLIP